MFRRPFLVLSLLLSALTASAASLSIEPPAPTTASRVRVSYVVRTCSELPRVAISGSKIAVVVDASGVCFDPFPLITFTTLIGRLPAGVYDLALSGSAVEPASSRLVVRDTSAFDIRPLGAPPEGNITAFILPDKQILPAKVLFGGVESAKILSTFDGGFSAQVPPHAPGDVDVTVIGADGTTLTGRAAFTYFDPAAAPDPFTFEPVLFPLAFSGPGLFGSQWITDNVLKTDYPTLVLPSPDAVKQNDPLAALVYAVRGSTANMRLGSRIADTSRQADTAGTEVHVARESDLRSTVRISNIPAAANSRATLRVWILGSDDSLALSLLVGKTGSFAPLSSSTRDGLTLRVYDVTAALAAGGDATISVLTPANARLWAVVSLTNNDTQQVTLVTPQ